MKKYRVLKIVSEQRKDLLSKLHNESASVQLQAYFEKLNEGSSRNDIDSFIEGAEYFANLCGPKRAEYYNSPLKGLHYPNSFAERWNQAYPLHRFAIWDEEERHQCPPSWTHTIQDSQWVLTYEGEELFPRGFNELIEGPTTLDCGMWCSLEIWMAARYTFGDKVLSKAFQFPKGSFTLSQHWEKPMSKTRPSGNLLFPFYDRYEEATDSSASQICIQTKTIYNYPKYHLKHSRGDARLFNTNKFRGSYHIFAPTASKTILSEIELEGVLKQAYNDAQSYDDLVQMWWYETFPTATHPRFTPKEFGALAKEATKYAQHTLDEKEWEDSRDERIDKARGLHLIFNFQRLIDCVEAAEKSNGGDALSKAKDMKRLEVMKMIVHKGRTVTMSDLRYLGSVLDS